MSRRGLSSWVLAWHGSFKSQEGVLPGNPEGVLPGNPEGRAEAKKPTCSCDLMVDGILQVAYIQYSTYKSSSDDKSHTLLSPLMEISK